MRNDPQVQFAQLFVLRFGRGVHHQVFGALVHREHHHLADVFLIGQQHHDAVDTSGTATVRGRAVLERVDHTAEALDHFVFAIAGQFEGFEHDLRLVVPDCARHQFVAVTSQVILEAFDVQRIAQQRVQTALRHRERVVVEVQTTVFFVQLEDREVDRSKQRRNGPCRSGQARHR